MNTMRLRLIAVTLASIAASCCASAPPEFAEDTSASVAMPEIDINALGVPYASVPDAGLLCAGQISPEQMDALHAAGFKTFISLRVAAENGAGWEEARKERGKGSRSWEVPPRRQGLQIC